MALDRMTVVPLAALSLVAVLGAGCSSAPATSNAGSAAGDAGAAVESVTLPCSINSGYPGDDVCLLPPDPKVGFQFHWGPSNYHDPNEVAKYLLMPGEEKTECVFFPSTNTETVYFEEYHSRLRPGSHHLLNYVQPVANGAAIHTSTAPEACNQSTFRNLFGATSPKMDVSHTSQGAENDGLAVALGPKSQVVMQLHVINASSKPILREAWANFRFADKSQITELGDPIQFLGGVLMSVPVGQTVVNKGTATVPANAAPDFRLIMAIPHVHAHTTKVTMWMTRGGKRELLLEQFGKLDVVTDPTSVYFNSVTQNPPPNEATQTNGAYSGIAHLAPGDTIDWECVQTNDGIGANGQTFTTPLQFTEQAYTGEMCNIFGLYGPTTGSSWDAYGY